MRTISERVSTVRKQLGLSQDELARLAKVSQSTIGNVEAGIRKQPRELIRIATALGVRAEWLQDGKPPMRNNVEEGPRIQGSVPLISWVAAGSFSEANDPYEVGDAEAWMDCPVNHGPRAYCLRVRGVSMYNPGGKYSYAEGDIIFVDPDRRPAHGDRVIVRLENESETTFKQYLEEGPDKFLKALNPHWPEQFIKITGDAIICGVVFGKWSD